MDNALWKQRTYYARRELGLCTKCGMEREKGSKYILCAACREKYRQQQADPDKREMRREYMKQYREEQKEMIERIAIYAQQLRGADELNSTQYMISGKHKCWGCFWGTWCRDRFFCPIYENCIKTKLKKQEGENNV